MMESLKGVIETSPVPEQKTDDLSDGLSLENKGRCFDPHSTNVDCQKCGGAGWYIKNGNPIQCENYNAEEDTSLHQKLIKQSNIQDIGRKTLSNFSTEKPDGAEEYSKGELNSLKTAWLAATGYANNPRGWLVFEGVFGCGKTHLALGIAHHAIYKKGIKVKFFTATGLLDEIKATFNNPDTNTEDVLDSIQNAQLLIVDDYGVESPTQWAREKLFQILNHRHLNRLPTVITTNLSLKQMPPRICSRMKDSEVVEYIKILAPDYRSKTTKISDIKRPLSLSVYSRISFDTLDSRVSESAKATGKKWVDNPHIVPFIYITGTYSSGKTHLAASMANNIAMYSSSVLFTTNMEIVQRLHNAISDTAKESVMQIVSEHINIRYLFIDDFTIKGVSAWAREQVFGILDQRMLRGLSTVITAIEPIERQENRLRARLKNPKLCFQLKMN